MQLLVVPLILTCGPAVLSTLSLVRAIKDYRDDRLRALPLWAVGGVCLIAAYAGWTFLYYTVKPPPDLPPWEDSETLYLALLFLLAPMGLVLTIVAGVRGASRRVVVPLLVGLFVLFFVGVLEGISV